MIAQPRAQELTSVVAFCTQERTEPSRTFHQLPMLYFNTAKEQLFKLTYGKDVCLLQLHHVIPVSADGRFPGMQAMLPCGARFQIYLLTVWNWCDVLAELSADETVSAERMNCDAPNFVHAMHSVPVRQVRIAVPVNVVMCHVIT